MMSSPQMGVDLDEVVPLGAMAGPEGTRFSLFTTPQRSCAVRIFDQQGRALGDRALVEGAPGFFGGVFPEVRAGALYKFVLDGQELPDPYARFMPFGVHGPALVVESRYDWRHGEGVHRPLREHVIYELHVGTFTPEGTYAGAQQRLRTLVDLGVTAIQLMPLAAFPGGRGWGYDGVALFSPFAGYGTPDELRAFIDEAHGLGLSVFLDAVYNHFGPSGNYLRAYSPEYFSTELKNAWGDAPNYAHGAMRRLVLSNAVYWLTEFRFDGLRLDATHAIVDPSPRHILRELADDVGRLRPRKLLIAEDERNEPALITEMGLDGVWADDFHHTVRVTLTGERDGYYAAYQPGAESIATAINGGWSYQGQVYTPSGHRRGRPAGALSAERFVYCIQNHDQIGNRALGDRLTEIVSIEAYGAASTLLLFLPMTPLLFMGQEWAARSPFVYFTDHEAELGRLVSEGRRAEFKGFAAFSDPERRTAIPDPQATSSFESSKLRWQEREIGGHAQVWRLYRDLLALRREDPVLRESGREGLEASAFGDVLAVRRWHHARERLLLVNFGLAPAPLPDLARGPHEVLFASDGHRTLGPDLPSYRAVILARDQLSS